MLTCDSEQAQGLVVNTSQNCSAKRRSKAALWATMTAAPLANADTSAGSMDLPATISSVMPVSLVISGGIWVEG